MSKACVWKYLLPQFLSRDLLMVMWKVKQFQLQGKFLCWLFPLSGPQEAFHRKLNSLSKVLVVLILGKSVLFASSQNVAFWILNPTATHETWLIWCHSLICCGAFSRTWNTKKISLREYFVQCHTGCKPGLISKYHRDWIKAKGFILLIPFQHDCFLIQLSCWCFPVKIC